MAQGNSTSGSPDSGTAWWGIGTDVLVMALIGFDVLPIS